MNEQLQESAHSALEERSRTLFYDSVESVDMRVRSRLTQARHAALDAAAASNRPWFARFHGWTPTAGVAAAAVLGVSLWFGNLTGSVADQPNLEDLDIVASGDANSPDAMEMLQDDLEFYDFADKAATAGPSA
jgi:negative regulator of sigma E activity